MKRKVLVLGSLSRSLVNFRGPLIKSLVARGHEVMVAAPKDDDFNEVRKCLVTQNVSVESIPLARGGLNVAQDFQSLRLLERLLHQKKPDILFAYTVKPVIYGGFAARKVGGIGFFPLITGLGYAFTAGRGLKRGLIRGVAKHLYRRSLAGARTVIFQNTDDERLFRDRRLVRPSVPSAFVNGSGVDLAAFPPSPLCEKPVFLMLARLVSDKGVREYVEAARIVTQKHPQAVFRLAGGFDPNPTGIGHAELQSWVNSGVVEYLGDVQTVQGALADSRFYVLPSYREGTPRSVLEAMATARPIITTDAPGCRETVQHGVNGLLVPPRDAGGLAEAMIRMLETPKGDVQRMADASLVIAREKFDVGKVNQQMLQIMGL